MRHTIPNTSIKQVITVCVLNTIGINNYPDSFSQDPKIVINTSKQWKWVCLFIFPSSLLSLLLEICVEIQLNMFNNILMSFHREKYVIKVLFKMELALRQFPVKTAMYRNLVKHLGLSTFTSHLHPLTVLKKYITPKLGVYRLVFLQFFRISVALLRKPQSRRMSSMANCPSKKVKVVRGIPFRTFFTHAFVITFRI